MEHLYKQAGREFSFTQEVSEGFVDESLGAPSEDMMTVDAGKHLMKRRERWREKKKRYVKYVSYFPFTQNLAANREYHHDKICLVSAN